MSSYANAVAAEPALRSRSRHPGAPSRRRAPPRAGRAADRIDLLMARYAAGDASAFGELYEGIAPALHRFCLRLAGRDEDASDILQDTLLRLHRARASYIPGSPTLSWAFAIARSSYLDRLRRRRCRPEVTLDLDAVELDHPASCERSGSPESDLCARDLLVVIDRELERMSEGTRMAYLLRWRDGLSVAEVAESLGTTWRTAKQRSQDAHEQIREALRQAGWSGKE